MPQPECSIQLTLICRWLMAAGGRLLTSLILIIAYPTSCGDGQSGPGVDAGQATPDGSSDETDQDELTAGHILMDFTRSQGFFTAPFPSQDLVYASGSIDLGGFPNPDGNRYVAQLLEILQRDSTGFGLTCGIYFQVSTPLAPERLPTLHQTVEGISAIGLLNVTPGSSDYLRRYPVTVSFEVDGGPFGAPNLLSLLPLQGVPLQPDCLHAAVVMRNLGDSQGVPLGPSPSLLELARGETPPGLPPEAAVDYRSALESLDEAGIHPDDLAALAVFRTGAPTRDFGRYRDHALNLPLPVVRDGLEIQEVFEDFCVYHSVIEMPVYQEGTPPFLGQGGAWALDEAGEPVLVGREEANLVLTIPRRAMPIDGFPVVVFIRTGGGVERPLVDRGTEATPGGGAIEAGSGPALFFARAGFAGISIDGPHGGLRNITHGDEQFLVFNINNPLAMRDNIRQSALEVTLTAHILEAMEFDGNACPGLVTGSGPVHFDVDRMALMGHSMGATIAPLALAYEPLYGAAILSGAGGSWIENVIYKLSPIEVQPLAELILGYLRADRTLHRHDVALTLLQWAGEPADPPVYAGRVVREPVDGPARQVLMLQGIVDTYILPPIANAMSLSLGLDLGGTPLDENHPDLADLSPLASLLDLAGCSQVTLPIQQNVVSATGDRVTAVVIQHPEDGIEDGHEVVFQTDLPKHQYRCFLESWVSGVARVPASQEEGCGPE